MKQRVGREQRNVYVQYTRADDQVSPTNSGREVGSVTGLHRLAAAELKGVCTSGLVDTEAFFLKACLMSTCPFCTAAGPLAGRVQDHEACKAVVVLGRGLDVENHVDRKHGLKSWSSESYDDG